MWPLLRRVAVTVTLAMFASAALMIVLVRATEERAERSRLRGPQPALRYIARTIAELPEAERERRVSELRTELRQELRIVRAPADSAARPRRSVALEHWVERGAAGEPLVVFRLDPTWVLRVGMPEPPPGMGPPPGAPIGVGVGAGAGMGPPPPAPWLPRLFGRGRRGPTLEFVLFLLAASALTTVLVAVPFARRLKKIEDGIDRLARGDFARAGDDSEAGSLSALSAALDRSAARLDRMFAERSELLQAVSHELGTPLSRVRFILAMLERATTDAERQKRMKELDREVTELDALSSELVHYVEADAAKLNPTTLDVPEVVRKLIDEERAANNRELDCSMDIPQGLELEANRRHFSRAISNLVRNGLRYARTKVLVDAKEATDEGQRWTVITVHDDGRGIPEEARERVLQPFVRLDASRSRSGGGTGLGLAIVRRIVERHGGKLTVDRSPLGGAALVTWWPSERRATTTPEANVQREREHS
ncbi:MAG: hypothetical protein JNK05_40875 [Myxococcales bacterium]|nr:hypothetical protein [Myxococcales bacterium]